MRRGVAAVVVLTLAAWSAPAGADEYVPEDPTFRPSLGWICWPDRVLGDFDGDGGLEPAMRWNRSGPHGACDEREPVDRWHVTLLFGHGLRVQRPAGGALRTGGVAACRADAPRAATGARSP